MTIPAYPLQWPAGWKRTPSYRRTGARFSTRTRGTMSRTLSVYDAVARVREELQRMSISDNDLVVSTNVPLRLDGWPRSDQRAPEDPGAAVYWTAKGATRCMAIDRYDSVAGNLAAIAATLEAMRAIDRHGGAEILDRAFTGFTALEPPAADWREVLDVPLGSGNTADELARARSHYRALASANHPDRGGSAEMMASINRAWEQAQAALS